MQRTAQNNLLNTVEKMIKVVSQYIETKIIVDNPIKHLMAVLIVVENALDGTVRVVWG